MSGNSLNTQSPMLQDFMNAMNQSIEDLLNLMMQKKTTHGGLSIKLDFSLSKMIMTDEETGEAVTAFMPMIKFGIKKSVRIESLGMKGEYTKPDYLLTEEQGSWTYRKKTDQMTLF